jgi:glycosyltransferase involved in cell wall biosynthesis
VFNAARFVDEAITSILGQTCRDIEVVVVDDGSTDATADIVHGFDDGRIVEVRHETNLGLVAALNTGLDVALGRYIAIQHADDVSMPDRLETLVALFEADTELVIAGSAWELIGENGEPEGLKRRPRDDAVIRWMSLFLTPFGHPTVMLRAETLRRYELRYEEDYFPAEDFRLWSRLLQHGRGTNVDRPLVRYRRHVDQITATTWDEQSAMAERISQINLRALGVNLEVAGVRRFRRLALNPPRRFAREDFALVPPLLLTCDLFEKSNPTADLWGTRRMIVDAALGSIARGAMRGVFSTGALAALARVAPIQLLTAPARRLARKRRSL